MGLVILDATTGMTNLLFVIVAGHIIIAQTTVPNNILNKTMMAKITLTQLSRRPKITVQANFNERTTGKTLARRKCIKTTEIGTVTTIFPTTGAF